MKYARAKTKPQRIHFDGQDVVLNVHDWAELPDAVADEIAPHTNIDVVAEKPKDEAKAAAKREEKREERAEARREEKIAVAIQSLKRNDAALWNQDGSPKVAAVRAAGDESLSDVTAEEVHAVWATFE